LRKSPPAASLAIASPMLSFKNDGMNSWTIQLEHHRTDYYDIQRPPHCFHCFLRWVNLFNKVSPSVQGKKCLPTIKAYPWHLVPYLHTVHATGTEGMWCPQLSYHAMRTDCNGTVKNARVLCRGDSWNRTLHPSAMRAPWFDCWILISRQEAR
jgi:hypothetical protein